MDGLQYCATERWHEQLSLVVYFSSEQVSMFVTGTGVENKFYLSTNKEFNGKLEWFLSPRNFN